MLRVHSIRNLANTHVGPQYIYIFVSIYLFIVAHNTPLYIHNIHTVHYITLPYHTIPYHSWERDIYIFMYIIYLLGAFTCSPSGSSDPEDRLRTRWPRRRTKPRCWPRPSSSVLGAGFWVIFIAITVGFEHKASCWRRAKDSLPVKAPSQTTGNIEISATHGVEKASKQHQASTLGI